MLHIKDIEAFARINEALNTGPESATPVAGAAHTMHPALLLALVATGRLPLSALPRPGHPTQQPETTDPQTPAPQSPGTPSDS
ncbi:hypothetical protein [Azospirillum griseum]|uniref:Uncharacterized protein n=1 Tax=Azospirillum griseum TaxID=2496639 RepID=A0A431VJT2_9PROT|nr:hypothetical protein [Azospirillum griseum]RTR22043.1 hypothetical protein EJ903_08030 [Azospirillum griseum]